ncbi:hypothetical protein [Trinickia sp.]|uniref:hypothetical protein n=1 Tax=Trinickia sp. TaxID=2571163 RepID=UPI003F7E6225
MFGRAQRLPESVELDARCACIIRLRYEMRRELEQRFHAHVRAAQRDLQRERVALRSRLGLDFGRHQGM